MTENAHPKKQQNALDVDEEVGQNDSLNRRICARKRQKDDCWKLKNGEQNAT